MEYYSAIKKKKNMEFAIKCTGLESIVLSEETRVEKGKPSMFSVIYESSILTFPYVYLCRRVCRGQTSRKGPIKKTLRGRGGNRTCDGTVARGSWGRKVK